MCVLWRMSEPSCIWSVHTRTVHTESVMKDRERERRREGHTDRQTDRENERILAVREFPATERTTTVSCCT